MTIFSQILRYFKTYSGEVFFIVYFLLATFFYLERSLFLDNAFQSFLLIQDQYIEINANRWPALIYRILPLIAVYLGLNLKLILWSFSINYVLVHFSLFTLIKYYCKDDRSGLALIALLGLAQYHGFYWCNSELVLALGVLTVWYSAMNKNKWILAILSSIILAWLHPLILIPFSFVLGLIVWNKGSEQIRNHISTLAFLLNYFIKDRLFPNWYDAIKRNEFTSNWEKYQIIDFDFGYSILSHSDKMIVLILVLTILVLIYQRSFYRILYFLAGSVLYLLILDIAESNAALDLQFYHEINRYPLLLMSIIAMTIGYNKEQERSIPTLTLLIILISFVRWSYLSTNYSDRIAWYSEFLENKDRCIYDFEDFIESPLTMSWASAYESLLISSLDGRSSTIIISKEPNSFNGQSRDTMLTEFRKYALEDLNKRYFSLEKKAYSSNCLD